MAGKRGQPKYAFPVREEPFSVDINDVTYGINGAVFEVNRELGPGFLEKVHPVK
jgi:hypothetical protein